MRRRNLIIGAGSAIAGSGAIVGSSAFSTSTAFGTVDVDVQGEDVEVYDSYSSANNNGGNGGVNTIEIDATSGTTQDRPRARSVNVDKDTFGLYSTGSYDITITLVNGNGAPISQLDDNISNIVDFRLLATTKGAPSTAKYVETDAASIRGDSSNSNTGDYPDGGYKDQTGTTRTYVPGVEQTVDQNGSITLSSGEKAQIATIVTVGDVDLDNSPNFNFPDFRIDISENSS